MFRVRRKIINDIRIRAQRWPNIGIGMKICCVKRFINQFCRVSVRL